MEELDETVRSHGVSDVQHRPVAGFPYLRTDRFLASFAPERPQGAELKAWLDRMQAAALEDLTVELANLPAGTPLPPHPRDSLASALDGAKYCADRLREHDLARPGLADRLADAATVPAEYRSWQRTVGLYYLSLMAVQRGVDRWQAETFADFGTAPSELPIAGKLTAYVPPPDSPAFDQPRISELIRSLPRDALGIPHLEERQRQLLFDAFAPTWVIDVASNADRPGRMVYPPTGGIAEADPTRPTVYRLLSFTRFHDQVLLQLNYAIWFPERPADGYFDLLGGHLDGLIWRVTLDREGRPLLFDSIHQCGCYHLFFPGGALPPARTGVTFAEDTLVPGASPQGDRARLRVAHSTHYLQSAEDTAVASSEITYRFADYDELRSLPLIFGGRRSLFGSDGIVAGTRRGERFVLWPMGVPEPGAMRQWGHHATAFVGERHFDDPRLIETSFRVQTP